MTEIGMCLSNPIISKHRKPGFVGLPLPFVSVKINGNEKDGGELLVKGMCDVFVFVCMWDEMG